MRRFSWIWAFGLLMVFGLLSKPAMAAVYSGTIKSISAETGSIVIDVTSTTKTKTVRVPTSAKVTLDGKTATLSQLKPGLRVSVFETSADGVTRVSARSGSSSRPTVSRPKTTRPRRPTTKPGPKGSSTGGQSAGWNQFRGPNRDNLSQETGLLKAWSSGGPRLLWTAKGLGEGYSTVSLADGLVLTMGNQAAGESIIALDLQTGQQRWSTRNGSPYRNGRGNGPRGTPTVDGDRLYALGANGDLSCLELKTGRVVWAKNILREFGGSNITWGISESVLIDGDRLICTPGGKRATMVALDKATGGVVWGSAVPGSPRASYASPIVAEVGGVRQYITFTARAVIGVRASDGTFMWEDGSTANRTAICSTPLFYRNHVFSASGYGAGGALLELASNNNVTRARQVYHTRDMKNHHGGMIVLDGHLYGSNDPGILTCLDLKTGRVVWQDRSVGKGSIAYADGHIYLRSEKGPVALVEATPAGYREKSRFDQPRRSSYPSWPHPVVADGKLFLRDMDILLCYDVKGRS